MRQKLVDKLLRDGFREDIEYVVDRLSIGDVEQLLNAMLQRDADFANDLLATRRHWEAVREAERVAAIEFEQQVRVHVPWAHPKHLHDRRLASLIAAGQVNIATYALEADESDPEVARTVFEGGTWHQRLCAVAAHWLNAKGWGWTTQRRGYSAGLADLRAQRISVFVECGRLSAPDKLLRAVEHGEAVLYVPWTWEFHRWADPAWRLRHRALFTGVFAFLVAPSDFELPETTIVFEKFRAENVLSQEFLYPEHHCEAGLFEDNAASGIGL